MHRGTLFCFLITLLCIPLNSEDTKVYVHNTCDDWGFFAHRKLNELAVYTIPAPLNTFYKSHLEEVRERAVDPDKRRYAIKGEAVRHYIDLDHWGENAVNDLPRQQERAIWRTAIFYWIQKGDTTLVFDTTQNCIFTECERDFTQAFSTQFLTLQKGISEKSAYAWLRDVAMREHDEFEWHISADKTAEWLGTKLGNEGYLHIDDRFSKHGIIPYFFPQHYRRLVRAFEEKNISKIVRLSADLGHYIGDAHVPLHTTKNYNGQLTGQDGIHAFWESRIPELFADDEFDYVVGRASYIQSPEEFIWSVVKKSHQGVDSVLSIEKRLSQTLPQDQLYCYESRLGAVVKLPCKEYARLYHQSLDRQVEERFRECILAIGSVWYSAWTDAGQPILNESPHDKKQDEDEMKALTDKQKNQIRVHE
ncbi:MAG: hypothetical protein IPH93_16845 [Saprospiraceae bacterium]|nr:hypothetical protein [Saprospiraceae bacterium]